MNEPDSNEKDSPANVSSGGTPDLLLVQDEAHDNRPDNLCNPVQEVVQRTSLDIEHVSVVNIEFCPPDTPISLLCQFDGRGGNHTHAKCRTSWKQRTWGGGGRSTDRSLARGRGRGTLTSKKDGGKWRPLCRPSAPFSLGRS